MCNFNCRTIPDVIAIAVSQAIHVPTMDASVVFEFHKPVTGIPKGQCSGKKKKKVTWIFKKKGFLLGPIPTQCLFVQHTRGNCTLFSKKAGGAADIVTLGVPVGQFRWVAGYFSQPEKYLTSPPVPESFDEAFETAVHTSHLAF